MNCTTLCVIRNYPSVATSSQKTWTPNRPRIPTVATADLILNDEPPAREASDDAEYAHLSRRRGGSRT
jgi:hypothetical protein